MPAKEIYIFHRRLLLRLPIPTQADFARRFSYFRLSELAALHFIYKSSPPDAHATAHAPNYSGGDMPVFIIARFYAYHLHFSSSCASISGHAHNAHSAIEARAANRIFLADIPSSHNYTDAGFFFFLHSDEQSVTYFHLSTLYKTRLILILLFLQRPIMLAEPIRFSFDFKFIYEG